jgi:dihydroorotase
MLAEAQQKGIRVTADVTAHHLHLSEHDIGLFNTLCHVQPPLRGKQDRRALRDALKSGVITAICSDHQPHGNDAKLLPFSESEPGISGLETLLSLTLKLVDEDELSLSQAIRLVTDGPAEIAGIDVGHLSVDARADICIFDPGQDWMLTRDSMLSRGKNTPFLNQTFRHKVTSTIIGGEVVYTV